MASTRSAVLAGEGAGRESGEERVEGGLLGPGEVTIGGGGARGAPIGGGAEGAGGGSGGTMTSIGWGGTAVMFVGVGTRRVFRSMALANAIKVWKLAGRGGTWDGSVWGPVTWLCSRCVVSSMLAWIGSIIVCSRCPQGWRYIAICPRAGRSTVSRLLRAASIASAT